jgi:hypothetical protein
MKTLKIYEYWINEKWDTSHSRAIIAESRDDADAAYYAALDKHDKANVDEGRTAVKCRMRRLKAGMVITPMGYDYCDLSFSMYNDRSNSADLSA